MISNNKDKLHKNEQLRVAAMKVNNNDQLNKNEQQRLHFFRGKCGADLSDKQTYSDESSVTRIDTTTKMLNSCNFVYKKCNSKKQTKTQLRRISNVVV